MSPTTLRLIGFLFLIAAVVASILNLKRVAGLGMIWLPAILIVFGASFIVRSRSRA